MGRTCVLPRALFVNYTIYAIELTWVTTNKRKHVFKYINAWLSLSLDYVRDVLLS